MLVPTKALTKKQKTQTIDNLMEASAPSFNFLLMMVLSTLIVTLGLLIDNLAVVIGGMLITPLLSPLLSFSMGVVVNNKKLMLRSVWVVAESILIIIFILVAVAFFAVDHDMVSSLVMQAEPSLAYLLIALFSGGAVAYAISRPSLSATLPGIAISVALLPPLAALGIGLSFFEWDIIARTSSLFALNFIGIILAAVFVFSFMNFHEVKSEITKNIRREQRQKN